MHPIAALLALQGWVAMTNIVGNAVAICFADKTVLRRCTNINGGTSYYQYGTLDSVYGQWKPREWLTVPESDLKLMLAAVEKGYDHAP